MPPDTGSRELLSSKTLRERLTASSVLTRAALEKALRWLDGLSADIDPLWAARSIATQGWLTPFQARAICDGRLRELQIGDYDVLDRLGCGGIGVVFKARHRHTRRVVAVKVLPEDLRDKPSSVQRFRSEAETAKRLNHPHIVPTCDSGNCEAGHFLVMEFIEGTDLDRLVRLRGALSPQLAATLIWQAACGLEYAHEQNVIHRDVKPANLLLNSEGWLKVTDFGWDRASVHLAEPRDATEVRMPSFFFGTVEYMPPEQACDASQVDHRADIYSLGCTLFFLLMARPPYQAETSMATLLQHQQAPIPSLKELRSDTPSDLDDLFQKMIAKSPNDRIGTMSEVIRELERYGLMLSDAEMTAELQRLRMSELNSSQDISEG